jgi:FkbM family methyltransferase
MEIMMEENLFVFDYCGKAVALYLPLPEDLVQSKIIKAKNFYEIDVLEEIGRFPMRDGIVCDIGANIGSHSVYFASILKREVFAFEPNKIAKDILEKNVLINELEDKIKIFQFALGAENKRGKLNINSGNIGASFINKAPFGDILIDKLDSVIAKDIRVALLKIDVEGFELEVLKGAEETIQANKPLIVIEAWTYREFLSISRLLSNYGYVPIGKKGPVDNYFFVHKDNEIPNEFFTYLQRVDNQIHNDLNLLRYKDIMQAIKYSKEELKQIINSQCDAKHNEVIELLQRERDAAVQERDGLVKKIDELNEDKGYSESEIEAQNEVIELLQRERDAAVQERDGLVKKIDELNEDKGHSESEIEAQNEVIELLQRERDAAVQERDGLVKKIDELMRDNQDLLQQNKMKLDALFYAQSEFEKIKNSENELLKEKARMSISLTEIVVTRQLSYRFGSVILKNHPFMHYLKIPFLLIIELIAFKNDKKSGIFIALKPYIDEEKKAEIVNSKIFKIGNKLVDFFKK